MFTADNQARARWFVEACYNTGNLAIMDEVVAPASATMISRRPRCASYGGRNGATCSGGPNPKCNRDRVPSFPKCDWAHMALSILAQRLGALHVPSCGRQRGTPGIDGDDWLYHFSQKWPLSGDHLSCKIMA
jgi:hypothetical protein